FATDMGRFFSLFDNRRLAQDVFTVVEDSRLDYRTRQEYPGLASAYRRVQQDALGERPKIEGMPLQEAMVEFLVRLSLQQNKGLPCPADYVDVAKAIEQVVRRVLSTKANVEDSAEATIRIYDLIAGVPNVEVPQEEWIEVEFDEEDLSPEELEQLLDQLRSAPGSASGSEDQQEEESYESPPQVDYRGDFKPELSQLLAQLRLRQGQGGQQPGSPLTKEMLEQLLANNPELELDAESGHLDADLQMFVENILKSANASPPQDPGQGYGPIPHDDDAGGSLEAKEPKTFVYDEWDFRAMDYKPRWCIVREKPVAEGETTFFTDTLRSYASMVTQIRRQFEMIMPEMFRKVKHLPDGDDFDLDAVIEAIIDKWAGMSPSDKVHWRRDKIERDVAVAFLLDMSASTAEAIDESRRAADTWDTPDDPVEYMAWLRRRRGEAQRRTYKRIIDLEKESIVLLITAMETIGDVYGIYGFSGYGRENVEFYVIKDMEEAFSDRVKKRIDKIAPLHATRMGPAIRHAAAQLERQDARTKLLLLLSDGRPQDRGYSREGVEKEYAVHDTKMALTEARRKGITPFCLTVDKAGHDYLKTMCQDMGYEVLADINSLPARLPALYRKLTF
ncbi:MAG: VWA domain-containing protein, partial [Dehalococcoidia bacterium]|nr:VWA domain-containing protein [Dehalococcoidia bacterium]